MVAGTHYETLGVPPDAAPEAIRAAYRRRARETHPDRGGDPDESARVNVAYEVLSDPARRERYDLGQPDNSNPIEHAARDKLFSIMMALITNNMAESGAFDLADLIRCQLEKGMTHVEDEGRKIEKRSKDLKALRARLKGSDLFEPLFQDQERAVAAATAAAKTETEVLKLALEMVKDLKDDRPATPISGFQTLDKDALRRHLSELYGQQGTWGAGAGSGGTTAT